MSEEKQIDITDEQVDAIRIANLLLDRPYADPDDDLSMLSRQLLRRHEELAAVMKERDEFSGRCESLSMQRSQADARAQNYAIEAGSFQGQLKRRMEECADLQAENASLKIQLANQLDDLRMYMSVTSELNPLIAIDKYQALKDRP